MEFDAKTNWQYNDTPTEDDFNRIEQGIADSFENADEQIERFRNNVEEVRINDKGKLEFRDGDVWVEVKSGTEFKVYNVIDLSIEAQAGRKIVIKWKDSLDSV